jgi:ribonuclease PH
LKEVVFVRVDGREPLQLRPIHIEPNYLMHPEGSVLISVGDTKVICAASIEERVPHFIKREGLWPDNGNSTVNRACP